MLDFAGLGGGIMYVTASTSTLVIFADKLLGIIAGSMIAFRSCVPGIIMVGSALP